MMAHHNTTTAEDLHGSQPLLYEAAGQQHAGQERAK